MAKSDEKLWEEVNEMLDGTDVDFGYLGTIEGNEVWAVDGNEVKVRKDKPTDEAIHMDFVEGGNDLEAAFVKREYGDHVILVDGHIDKECWPFILYHEAFERRMMERGWTYERAHTAANEGERELRMRVGEAATK